MSSPDADKNLLLLCLNRKDGKVLWQKTVARRRPQQGPQQHGFAFAGDGWQDGCSSFSARATWRHMILTARNLEAQSGKEYGRFADMWLYGSSPLLFEGKLYVQVLERNPVARRLHQRH